MRPSLANSFAPLESWENGLDFPQDGCYYQYQYYNEGDQIKTNEPCLNCTCKNQMLMCYLNVCPFIKPVGKNCVVEKHEDQCCPTIMCPQVPVELWTSTTLPPPMLSDESAISSTSTDGFSVISASANISALPMTSIPGQGCNINDQFYMDGMQIPRDPNNPCELCYCIRNHTACVMQECRLKVPGCEPIFQEGVCCPVKYMCKDGIYFPGQGGLIGLDGETETTALPAKNGCYQNGKFIEEGTNIETQDPCEHCYCMGGDIICAIDPCMGGPLEGETDNCIALPPPEGECCTKEYVCTPNNITDILDSVATTTVTNDIDQNTGDEIILPESTEGEEKEPTDEIQDDDDEDLPLAGFEDNGAGSHQGQGSSTLVQDGNEANVTESSEEPQSSAQVKPLDSSTMTPPEEAEGDEDSPLTTTEAGKDKNTCSLNGTTYDDGADVPSQNPCNGLCQCYKGAIICASVDCLPPPKNHLDCKPIYTEGQCCPTYDCLEILEQVDPDEILDDDYYSEDEEAVSTSSSPIGSTTSQEGTTSNEEIQTTTEGSDEIVSTTAPTTSVVTDGDQEIFENSSDKNATTSVPLVTTQSSTMLAEGQEQTESDSEQSSTDNVIPDSTTTSSDSVELGDQQNDSVTQGTTVLVGDNDITDNLDNVETIVTTSSSQITTNEEEATTVQSQTSIDGEIQDDDASDGIDTELTNPEETSSNESVGSTTLDSLSTTGQELETTTVTGTSTTADDLEQASIEGVQSTTAASASVDGDISEDDADHGVESKPVKPEESIGSESTTQGPEMTSDGSEASTLADVQFTTQNSQEIPSGEIQAVTEGSTTVDEEIFDDDTDEIDSEVVKPDGIGSEDSLGPNELEESTSTESAASTTLSSQSSTDQESDVTTIEDTISTTESNASSVEGTLDDNEDDETPKPVKPQGTDSNEEPDSATADSPLNTDQESTSVGDALSTTASPQQSSTGDSPTTTAASAFDAGEILDDDADYDNESEALKPIEASPSESFGSTTTDSLITTDQGSVSTTTADIETTTEDLEQTTIGDIPSTTGASGSVDEETMDHDANDATDEESVKPSESSSSEGLGSTTVDSIFANDQESEITTIIGDTDSTTSSLDQIAMEAIQSTTGASASVDEDILDDDTDEAIVKPAPGSSSTEDSIIFTEQPSETTTMGNIVSTTDGLDQTTMEAIQSTTTASAGIDGVIVDDDTNEETESIKPTEPSSSEELGSTTTGAVSSSSDESEIDTVEDNVSTTEGLEQTSTGASTIINAEPMVDEMVNNSISESLNTTGSSISSEGTNMDDSPQTTNQEVESTTVSDTYSTTENLQQVSTGVPQSTTAASASIDGEILDDDTDNETDFESETPTESSSTEKGTVPDSVLNVDEENDTITTESSQLSSTEEIESSTGTASLSTIEETDQAMKTESPEITTISQSTTSSPTSSILGEISGDQEEELSTSTTSADETTAQGTTSSPMEPAIQVSTSSELEDLPSDFDILDDDSDNNDTSIISTTSDSIFSSVPSNLSTGEFETTMGSIDSTTNVPDSTTKDMAASFNDSNDFVSTTTSSDLSTPLLESDDNATTGAPDMTTGAPDMTTGAPDMTTGAPDMTTASVELNTNKTVDSSTSDSTIVPSDFSNDFDLTASSTTVSMISSMGTDSTVSGGIESTTVAIDSMAFTNDSNTEVQESTTLSAMEITTAFQDMSGSNATIIDLTSSTPTLPISDQDETNADEIPDNEKPDQDAIVFPDSANLTSITSTASTTLGQGDTTPGSIDITTAVQQGLQQTSTESSVTNASIDTSLSCLLFNNCKNATNSEPEALASTVNKTESINGTDISTEGEGSGLLCLLFNNCNGTLKPAEGSDKLDSNVVDNSTVVTSDYSDILDDDSEYNPDEILDDEDGESIDYNQDECVVKNETYGNFADVPSENPCELCYCNYGHVICSTQICEPPQGFEDCTPLETKANECCPRQYDCAAPSLETSTVTVTVGPSGEVESTTAATGIPGEGNCLQNGISFSNGSTVPLSNKCHAYCLCVDSEIKCDRIPCHPAPDVPGLKCEEFLIEGECCPSHNCVSAESPVIEAGSSITTSELEQQANMTSNEDDTVGTTEGIMTTTFSSVDASSVGPDTPDSQDENVTENVDQQTPIVVSSTEEAVSEGSDATTMLPLDEAETEDEAIGQEESTTESSLDQETNANDLTTVGPSSTMSSDIENEPDKPTTMETNDQEDIVTESTLEQELLEIEVSTMKQDQLTESSTGEPSTGTAVSVTDAPGTEAGTDTDSSSTMSSPIGDVEEAVTTESDGVTESGTQSSVGEDEAQGTGAPADTDMESTTMTSDEIEEESGTMASVVEVDQGSGTTSSTDIDEESGTTTAVGVEDASTTESSVNMEVESGTMTSADINAGETTAANDDESVTISSIDTEDDSETTTAIDIVGAGTEAPVEDEIGSGVGSVTTVQSTDLDQGLGTTLPSVDLEEGTVTTSSPTDLEEGSGTMASIVDMEEGLVTTSSSTNLVEGPLTTSSSTDLEDGSGTMTSIVDMEEGSGTMTSIVDMEEGLVTTSSSTNLEEGPVTTSSSIDLEEGSGTMTSIVDMEEGSGAMTSIVDMEEGSVTTMSSTDLEGLVTTSSSIDLEEGSGTMTSITNMEEGALTTSQSIDVEGLASTPTVNIEESVTMSSNEIEEGNGTTEGQETEADIESTTLLPPGQGELPGSSSVGTDSDELSMESSGDQDSQGEEADSESTTVLDGITTTNPSFVANATDLPEPGSEQSSISTTQQPIDQDNVVTSTTIASGTIEYCLSNGMVIQNGKDVPTSDPCKLCQCVDGDVICAVRECPVPEEFKNCRALPIPRDECCPQYTCDEILDDDAESDYDYDLNNQNMNVTETTTTLGSITSDSNQSSITSTSRPTELNSTQASVTDDGSLIGLIEDILDAQAQVSSTQSPLDKIDVNDTITADTQASTGVNDPIIFPDTESSTISSLNEDASSSIASTTIVDTINSTMQLTDSDAVVTEDPDTLLSTTETTIGTNGTTVQGGSLSNSTQDTISTTTAPEKDDSLLTSTSNDGLVTTTIIPSVNITSGISSINTTEDTSGLVNSTTLPESVTGTTLDEIQTLTTTDASSINMTQAIGSDGPFEGEGATEAITEVPTSTTVLSNDSTMASVSEASEASSTATSSEIAPANTTTTPATTTTSVIGTASSDVLGESDPQSSALAGTEQSTSEDEVSLDDYENYDQISLDQIGPGACLFDGKIYVSAQQIPRENPCDFCFCFRGDIICLQQSCPPPIPGCNQEPIEGFCCPRYECPVKMGLMNVTTTIAQEPPSFVQWLMGNGGADEGEEEEVTEQVRGCEIQGNFYERGAIVESASGPCLQCRCGYNEKLECEPQPCEPAPLMKRMLTLR
ncbi:serine-rich adhesin for platelets-like [Tigriopus californicus]|uniref:serine-rich adhesin for platelets-like n=1 Tax=Tigriopus californicus TaxID=6832 RepID=UPI0027DA1E0A|nr:serine-rich adhesin for platelets-like [Tigriopus californicus]